MILGSVNSSASLDGVSGSQPLAPQGTLIQKSSPMALPPALPCTTWARTSNTVGVFTVANTLVNGNKVAVSWVDSSGNQQYCADGVVSTQGASPTITFSARNLLVGGSTAQTVLPAANYPVLISLLTQATGLNIIGSDLDQLLIQSTQPALVELFDNTGTPVLCRTSVITTNNGFDGWPTTQGQAVPFSNTIVTANFYNMSVNTAITQVVALLY